jgi:hypothetical protein
VFYSFDPGRTFKAAPPKKPPLNQYHCNLQYNTFLRNILSGNAKVFGLELLGIAEQDQSFFTQQRGKRR